MVSLHPHVDLRHAAARLRGSRTPTSRLRGAYVAWLFALGCVHARPRVVVPRPHVPPHQRFVGDFSPRIDDDAMWAALAASPGREMVARTDIVKVIIDLEDSWRVYFLQSVRWEIHYFFAARFLSSALHPVEDHAAFNIREYRQPDRRFVLGTLAHYRDQDVWAFELIAGDQLDLARTTRAFQLVRERVYFGARLRYRPVPPEHERRVEEFRAAGVPIVTTNDIFGATRYQPLNPGEAFGYLRFLTGEPTPAQVRRTDVVVLETVPLDLPVCAGIVTTELQTPLGHVAVLASNRGTPNMALRGGFRDPQLRALEGRLVRLHVTPQDFTVTAATQAQAERAWESARPRTPFSPQLSLTDVGLPDLHALGLSHLDIAGAKAAQLGELTRVQPPVNVPRGFVIPFRGYHDHLAATGIDSAVRAALVRPDFVNDVQVRLRVLAEVRQRIEAASMDPRLLAAVRARIQQLFPGVAVRFRSSTNAEDLPGFNGAGLYRSTRVAVGADDAAIATAIRAVWSSVWSLQAHEERTYFRIDPLRVAMAVLVQESIDDDVVDGVALTGNPFNQGRPGLFINVQVAGAEGGAVTSARGDDVPEQILYYTYAGEREFERMSRSTRTRGAPVLRDDEVFTLSQVLRAIHGHFIPSDITGFRAMDVEFILSGAARRIVIVQARPYTLRYDEGRAMAAQPE